MKLSALVATLVMASCGRTQTSMDIWEHEHPLWSEDGPDVFCPDGRVCQVWKLKLDATKLRSGGFECVMDPRGLNGPGRLIAVNPNNSRIIVVALGDGCYEGNESGYGTFHGGEKIR